jgi:hypothetical protein
MGVPHPGTAVEGREGEETQQQSSEVKLNFQLLPVTHVNLRKYP